MRVRDREPAYTRAAAGGRRPVHTQPFLQGMSAQGHAHVAPQTDLTRRWSCPVPLHLMWKGACSNVSMTTPQCQPPPATCYRRCPMPCLRVHELHPGVCKMTARNAGPCFIDDNSLCLCERVAQGSGVAPDPGSGQKTTGTGSWPSPPTCSTKCAGTCGGPRTPLFPGVGGERWCRSGGRWWTG